MRLIDADALLERYDLNDATKYGNKNKAQIANSYSTMYMYEIADMIDDAPTIDAVEQKHGHWNYDEECECYVCSVCEMSALNNWRNKSTNSNYCPHCGSKMDEVTEDE